MPKDSYRDTRLTPDEIVELDTAARLAGPGNFVRVPAWDVTWIVKEINENRELLRTPFCYCCGRGDPDCGEETG